MNMNKFASIALIASASAVNLRTNGDSQSFISRSLAEVTPATNVPANPALTAGAKPDGT